MRPSSSSTRARGGIAKLMRGPSVIAAANSVGEGPWGSGGGGSGRSTGFFLGASPLREVSAVVAAAFACAGGSAAGGLLRTYQKYPARITPVTIVSAEMPPTRYLTNDDDCCRGRAL